MSYDFGRALQEIREGGGARRERWNEGDEVYECGEDLLLRTGEGDLMPWPLSRTDILAEDWELCVGPKKPDFGWALEHLRDEKKVKRQDWGEDVLLYLTEGSHIDIVRGEGGWSVPWEPSQRDLLAEDWVLVED